MQPYPDVLFSSSGPVPNVSVTVKTYPAGAVATIYSDNGSTVRVNPVVTGNDGRFLFYAADGYYTLTVSATNILPVTIGPILLQDYASKTVFVSNWLPAGYVTDGSVDYSTQFQAAIDANKGKTIILDQGLTVLAAGVLLNGSTYNNTRLICEGTFKLKASGGSANFGGAWVGIIVKDCDNVTVSIADSDGNRSNQAATEFHHILGFAGATNFKVPYFSAREIRGDGIYIGQKDWTANTTNSSNGVIGTVKGYNTADDGRNLVSVVSCDALSIDQIHSYQIGGTIATVVMPGGLDIEPDHTYQSVSDVSIGTVNVVTAGTAGVQISGKAVINDATRDWNCQRITIGSWRVDKTSADNGSPIFQRVRDLNTNGAFYRTGTAANGIRVDFADRVAADLTSYNCTYGVLVGFSDFVNDFDIRVGVGKYTATGLLACGVNRGRFLGRVYGATSASSTFAIQTQSNSRALTQSKVIYSVDTPFDANNTRAFRNETGDTVAFSACRWENCDVSGYASYAVCFQNITAGMTKFNLAGVTEATVAPGNGTWLAGDTVFNTAPAVGLATRWQCTAGGTPGTWIPEGIVPGLSSAHGNASFSFAPGVDPQTQQWTSAITADRSATADKTGAWAGAKFRVVRLATCTGAFNINVLNGTAGPTLKAMATPGSFCDVEYDGANWILTAYGVL